MGNPRYIWLNCYLPCHSYKGDTNYLSVYMKEEWKNEIYDDIINIIYNTHIDKQQRLLAFNSRIDIRIKNHSAYIINNAFN